MLGRSYWLSRMGAPTEGPYSHEQVLEMWRSRKIALEDGLCLEGAEKWIPAHVAMPDWFGVKIPKAPGPSDARLGCVVSAWVLAGLGVVALLFFFILDMPTYIHVSAWVDHHHPGLSMKSLGDEKWINGKPLRLLRLSDGSEYVLLMQGSEVLFERPIDK